MSAHLATTATSRYPPALPERREPWPLDEMSWAIDLPEPLPRYPMLPPHARQAAPTFAAHGVADLGSRLLAAIIDAGIQVGALAAGFMALVTIAVKSGQPGQAQAQATTRLWAIAKSQWAGHGLPVDFLSLTLLAAAALLAGHVAYYAILEMLTNGRTPGKIALGLRVVGAHGEPSPGKGRLLARNLLRVIDLLPWAYALGAALVAAQPQRGRVGDRLAKTVVARARPLRELFAASRTPPLSAYSTSELGYLLEAWLARRPELDPDAAEAIAERVARYLEEQLPTHGDFVAQSLFARDDFAAYLAHRWQRERPA